MLRRPNLPKHTIHPVACRCNPLTRGSEKGHPQLSTSCPPCRSPTLVLDKWQHLCHNRAINVWIPPACAPVPGAFLFPRPSQGSLPVRRIESASESALPWRNCFKKTPLFRSQEKECRSPHAMSCYPQKDHFPCPPPKRANLSCSAPLRVPRAVSGSPPRPPFFRPPEITLYNLRASTSTIGPGRFL